MTSNTQQNTTTNTASTGNTGLRDDDPNLTSQAPSSGIETGTSEQDRGSGSGMDSTMGTTEQRGAGTGTSGSGTGTGPEYGSSTTQQQYGQGTIAGQYEEGLESGVAGSGQQQYGHGQGGAGTGVGHHKTHHESPLHGHGPSEAAKAGCEQCTGSQAAGRTLVQDTEKTTTGTSPSTGTGTTTTTSTTTTGSGHHGLGFHHHGGTGAKPSATDKIIGGVEKVAGKLTSDAEMYQRGQERATGFEKKN